MKKPFAFLLIALLSLVFAGCQPQESAEETAPDGKGDKVDLSEELGETPAEPREWEFQHTASADSYKITVLHNGEPIGSIDKEVPADGYNPYIFETTDNDVFFAIDPTGLGGYILYSYAFDLYRYNVESGEFTEVPVDNVYDISSDGNLVAYNVEYEGPKGSTFGIAVYDLTENAIVSSWTNLDEFEQFGDARFSLSDKNLAFQATDTDDENGLEEETALFFGSAVGGEYMEVDRQEGLFAVSWETNETLLDLEAANQ